MRRDQEVHTLPIRVQQDRLDLVGAHERASAPRPYACYKLRNELEVILLFSESSVFVEPTSCSIDYLLERIWGVSLAFPSPNFEAKCYEQQELGLVKVYTKKRGIHPDLTDPICLRKGATIEVSTDY